jgi:ParB family chromosome partitioning protein
MKRLIEHIKVGERDRSDLGDTRQLADSIAAVGLMHPVVITASGELVAGGRRLAAVTELGWTEVPVTVVDLATAADVLRGEADENTCRKPLTPYEASRARERRAQVLAPKAEERKAHGETAPGRPKTPPDGGSNLVPASVRKTKNVAAVGTGYSGSTLDKVDRIRDVAERGVVRQGKAEVPVPEPVREVAREALAEVKVTGAAVDRASRKVDEALTAHVEESVDVQRAKHRRSWRTAFSAAMELEHFDPARIAAVIELDEWTEIQLAVKGLTDWYGRLLDAKRDGLRIVKGAVQ